MTSSPSRPSRRVGREHRVDEIAETIALVVGGNDDRQCGRWDGGQRMRLQSTIIQPQLACPTGRPTDLDEYSRLLACRRAAPAAPAVARPADGRGPGALRLRRRAGPRGRPALPRRVGSEAAGDPLPLRRPADAVAGRCRRRPRPISRPRRLSRGCSTGSARLAGPAGTGAAAALLFLFLSNPAFTRVAGIRLRSQCETFIAVAVAGRAAASLLRGAAERQASGGARDGRRRRALRPGVHVQVQRRRLRRRRRGDAVAVQAPDVRRLLLRSPPGSCCRSLAILHHLRARRRPAAAHRRHDSLQPRVLGRDLRSALDVVRYLVTFPIERARVDALWTRRRRGLPPAAGGRAHATGSGWCRSSGSPPPARRSRSTAAAACRSTSSRPTRRWRSPPDGAACWRGAWLRRRHRPGRAIRRRGGGARRHRRASGA